jgi:hypothetical protein
MTGIVSPAVFHYFSTTLPNMRYKVYKEIAKKHKPLPLIDERRLISLAKKGDGSARQKLLLHLIGFFIFRIETSLFPHIKNEFGDDILQECIVFAEGKIDFYKLRYKNKSGVFKKVFLRSYLWKGVTGVMLNHVKRNSPASVWKISGRQDVLISNYPAENSEEYDDL